jgi:hypothetical protein
MSSTVRRLLGAATLLGLIPLSTGCAAIVPRVRPWDRDLLAEKKMSVNPAPLVQEVDDHIYFSREGSTGGHSVGGGGCGCN